jgi:hypothetical protein
MSRIKKAMLVFAMLKMVGDHPKMFVKRDRKVGYMIKCPP